MDEFLINLSRKDDKELIALYGRTQIDFLWLGKMIKETASGTPAHSHYYDQYKKEKKHLEALIELMEKKGLLEPLP